MSDFLAPFFVLTVRAPFAHTGSGPHWYYTLPVSVINKLPLEPTCHFISMCWMEMYGALPLYQIHFYWISDGVCMYICTYSLCCFYIRFKCILVIYRNVMVCQLGLLEMWCQVHNMLYTIKLLCMVQEMLGQSLARGACIPTMPLIYARSVTESCLPIPQCTQKAINSALHTFHIIPPAFPAGFSTS